MIIMNQKNKIYFVIMIVVILLVSIIMFSFAYIGRANVIGNTNTNATIVNATQYFNLTYSGAADLSLNVSLDNLAYGSASNSYTSYISNTTTITMNFKVTSSNYTSGGKCAYTIKYVANTNGTYTQSSAATSAGLRELAISGTNGTDTFSDVNLSGVGTSGTTLYSGIINTNTYNSTTSKTWTFTMKFYNLNIDQSSVLGSNPSGKIRIESGACGAN